MNPSHRPIVVYLSLGSNLGDRMAHLADAKDYMKGAGLEILKESKIYETELWPLHGVEKKNGRPFPTAEGGRHWHLNQVLKAKTDLEPLALLHTLQDIEGRMGRTYKGSGAPRTIDIDALLYGDEVIDLPELTIPHRHMSDRQFVLVPLLEIAPDLADPVSGKSYQQILSTIKDAHKVQPYL